MSKPGVVLKRPVGANGRFREHAQPRAAAPLIRPLLKHAGALGVEPVECEHEHSEQREDEQAHK